MSDQSSGDGDELIGQIFGLLVLLAILGAGYRYAWPRLSAWWGSANSRWAAQAGDIPAALGPYLWFPISIAVVLGVGWMGRVWLARRAARRHQRFELLGATLESVMPRSWSYVKGLKVLRWRGTSPSVIRLKLTPDCPDHDPDWRGAVVAAAAARMGSLATVDWSQADRRRVVQLAVGQQEDSSVAKEVEPVQAALAGLVPGVSVRRQDDALVIGYAETTRDQSPQWRSRVVDQVRARTGGTYRATWDRLARELTLSPVPQLPGEVRWEDAHPKVPVVAGRRLLPFGVDEHGDTVAWEMGNRFPHALVVGETGTGKTEAIRAIVMSALSQGVLVAVCDPKAKDFTDLLGRPGVVCVATSPQDRVHLLRNMHSEMQRRVASHAAQRLVASRPGLGVIEGADHDHVPILFVIDEMTQFTQDMTSWWAALSKEEKIELGGSGTSRVPPMASYPAAIARLARSVGIHMLIGMQRADAGNFGGDSTEMRDNLAFRISQGQVSYISSEMVWGDRGTGSLVEIASVGEGVTNGSRISEGRVVVAPGASRYKAWRSESAAGDETVWAQIAKVAPDASRVHLPDVSGSARSIQAALEELTRRSGTVLVPGSEVVCPQAGVDAVPLGDTASIGEPSAAAADTAGIAPGVVTSLDAAGVQWEAVAAALVEVGDVVLLGDGEDCEVIAVDGWQSDEFSGEDVFRITVLQSRGEADVDLSGEEMIERKSLVN